MCTCLRVTWGGAGGGGVTVLASGAQPCVLLCGLPDSRAWLQMAQRLRARISRRWLARPHGHRNGRTWTCTNPHVRLPPLFGVHSRQNPARGVCDKSQNTWPTAKLFLMAVSRRVRQHILAGVAAAGMLARCEGGTTGTST